MDLNDLRYFALIVQHGGFSAAERHSHITKSKLSRRVAGLEAALGVRLLQRSTRRLVLTEAGRSFYAHCAAMLVEAEAAQQAVEQLRSEPAGSVRMTCPVAMAQVFVARILSDFMARYPLVRVELDASDRLVNLMEERMDIALRARDSGLRDPGLVARRVAASRMLLVASPAFVAANAPLDTPEQLAGKATIGALAEGQEQQWSLVTAEGESARLSHRPRLLCSDFTVQYVAATGGVGIALLPQRVAGRGLREGLLARVAPEWATAEQDIHLVYARRRGMLPSVQALVDFLAVEVPKAMEG